MERRAVSLQQLSFLSLLWN